MTADGEPIKVLMADDDPIVRAVLDCVMADGGGPQAGKDTGDVSPHTKVIALTASDSEHAALDMPRAGA